MVFFSGSPEALVLAIVACHSSSSNSWADASALSNRILSLKNIVNSVAVSFGLTQQGQECVPIRKPIQVQAEHDAPGPDVGILPSKSNGNPSCSQMEWCKSDVTSSLGGRCSTRDKTVMRSWQAKKSVSRRVARSLQMSATYYTCQSTCSDPRVCQCLEAGTETERESLGFDCWPVYAASCTSGDFVNCVNATLADFYEHVYCPMAECMAEGGSGIALSDCYCDGYASFCKHCNQISTNGRTCTLMDGSSYNITDICGYATEFCGSDPLVTAGPVNDMDISEVLPSQPGQSSPAASPADGKPTLEELSDILLSSEENAGSGSNADASTEETNASNGASADATITKGGYSWTVIGIVGVLALSAVKELFG